MRPVLFDLGAFEVRAYGVFVALAFVASWLVLRAELGRRAGRGEAGPIAVAAAVGGFVGARAYWYVEHSATVGVGDLSSGAGFTWYGGVVGGALGVLLVASRRGIPLAVLLASVAPALALGYALGRVACQFAGDGTYGVASDLPWAMSYPHGDVPTTQRVHPTPVYETLTGLLIFAVLWRVRDRLAPVRLFGLYLALSGIERFLVEFIRRNDEVVAGLTQPQLFAIAFALAGAGLLAWRRPAGMVARSFASSRGHEPPAALRYTGPPSGGSYPPSALSPAAPPGLKPPLTAPAKRKGHAALPADAGSPRRHRSNADWRCARQNHLGR